jgi:hypothetical protein
MNPPVFSPLNCSVAVGMQTTEVSFGRPATGYRRAGSVKHLSSKVGSIMLFREEPVTPVYRRWMCEQIGCNGELLSTGEGITRLNTRWKHRCAKCGHEDWADATYPRVAFLPIDAIGPDDSYT